MLNFSEFKDYVTEHLREELPEELKDAAIDVRDIVKNNGLTLTAITVKAKDNCAAPTIYLDDYFKEYQKGSSLATIVTDIAQVSTRCQTNEFSNISNDYKNFDFVKERIVMGLVNAERNAELLKSIPHTMYEDLAIVYKVLLKTSGEGMATVKITDEHLKMWGGGKC